MKQLKVALFTFAVGGFRLLSERPRQRVPTALKGDASPGLKKNAAYKGYIYKDINLQPRIMGSSHIKNFYFFNLHFNDYEKNVSFYPVDFVYSQRL